MKLKTARLTSVLLVIAMAFCSLGLSSCYYSEHDDFLDALEEADFAEGSDSSDSADESGTAEASDTADTDGTTDATDSTDTTDTIDTTDDASGNIIQNITNNTITITGNTSGSVAHATAMGLRSALSIYCTFESTTSSTFPWSSRPSTTTYYTTGSGVIYKLDENGNALIITNHHVVYSSSSDTENGISDKIYVYLYGRESEALAISATYVGGSANYDLAVLRVDSSEVLKQAYLSGAAAAVSIADSDKISAGQSTIVIGNPSSSNLSGISVTSGIVSVDSEYITMTSSTGSGEVEFRVIRTDAPVNSGNSGGGMYNDKGELIGIVNAKISSSDIENIGYALPSNVVRAIADNIIYYCYDTDCESVMRCILGITVQVSNYDTYYDTSSGLLVRNEQISIYEVSSGGLGEAILKEGDVVKSITVGDITTTVTRQHHLIDAMLDARVGDSVGFTIIRGSTQMNVSIIITEDCISAY